MIRRLLPPVAIGKGYTACNFRAGSGRTPANEGTENLQIARSTGFP